MIEPDKERFKSNIQWREFRLRYNDVVMQSPTISDIINRFAVHLYNQQIQRANAVQSMTMSQGSEQQIA